MVTAMLQISKNNKTPAVPFRSQLLSQDRPKLWGHMTPQPEF